LTRTRGHIFETFQEDFRKKLRKFRKCDNDDGSDDNVDVNDRSSVACLSTDLQGSAVDVVASSLDAD